MTRPRLLDLFSGDGGAGEGYRLAGFDVTGVDVVPFAYPPGEFVQADALAFVREHGGDFDAIHASPPCHDHTRLGNAHGLEYGTAHLLAETLAELRRIGRPFVVENVESPTVRAAMTAAGSSAPFMLCGSSFGLELRHHGLLLQLRRHRLFSTSFPMLAPPCQHRGEALDVTGHSQQGRIYRRRREQGVPAERLAERRAVMGLPWMDREALAEAIPPAFTEHLGGWLLEHLADAAAA